MTKNETRAVVGKKNEGAFFLGIGDIVIPALC